MTSDVEMESEEEREELRKKRRERSRSRSRSRSKDKTDKRKHKKHKKDRKKYKKRESDDEDTGNEGGETPESKAQVEEDGELSGKKEKRKGSTREKTPEERDRRKYDRSREKRRGRSRSREREREKTDVRENYKREEKKENVKENEPGEIDQSGGSQVLSLSVEETNKLRAKLGLKPLNVSQVEEEDENSDQPGVLIPGDRDKTRHLAPEHWGQRDFQKKMRDRLTVSKEKRKISSKLSAVKGLGDSDSDDDATKWIEKQKRKVKEKEEAEKRAKAMEELDEEFGVGDIVESDLKDRRQKDYSGSNLKGIRVEHSSEAFSERDTVLTLKDQDVLDDKYEDVLVNVNIVDDERTKKSLQNIKAGKEGYQAYATEEVDEFTGETKKKDLLYQYKEELEGEKKESFTLEAEGQYSEEANREKELAMIRHKLKLQNTVSLTGPAPKLASDYYTEQEMVSFKKPKKKKKVKKKMLKADDLLAMIGEDDVEMNEAMAEKQKKRSSRIIDDDVNLSDGRLPASDNLENFKLEAEPELKSLTALKVAQKLRKIKTVDKVAEEILLSNKQSADDEMMDEDGSRNELIIDQTKEFCRGLTEISYSQSGMGETVDQELLDFEKKLESKRLLERSKMEDEMEKKEIAEKSKKSKRGTWEKVDHEIVEEGKWKEGARGKPNRRRDQANNGKAKDNDNNGKAILRPSILDDEAMASTSMGAALKLANQKGYLDAGEEKMRSAGLQHLRCQNYNIEDKSRDHEEDDRKRRGAGRDRGSYSGPTQTFSEKKHYKPSVNIEYIDDGGRSMTSKEAFRYLSHKFHGKGSGKLKTEKRHRKIQEEKLMEKMSSTDTPLNTLTKLKHKTKEMSTPYIILSGNKAAEPTSLKK